MQRPNLLHLPAGKVSSDGAEVVELAASAGLVLDDWQAWCLSEGLAARVDGSWAAFESVIDCPRQNGKDGIFEALELGALFLFEIGLITHSAHEFKTAREHFLRMQALLRGAPELLEQVEYIHTGAGSESIGLKSGARLNFIARSRGSGRGFSADLVIMNEAFKLPPEAIGAMLPALSARPNPQVWYGSSAAHADSEVMHGLRRRAQSGDGGRLFYAGWNNLPGVSIDDDEALYRANPALGIRISLEHCHNEREAMRHLGNEFARERLGVPDEEDRTSGIFPPGTWEACRDRESVAIPQGLALDVSPGMGFASFAIAGTRSDGLTHVELVDRQPGTGWVIDRARILTDELGLPVSVDPRGPVAGLLDDLEAASIKVELLADGQLPKACATLQERVLTGTIRHKGQIALDQAVAGAGVRIQGDAWRWGRTASRVDISPLVAITIALATEPVPGAAQVINLSEV